MPALVAAAPVDGPPWHLLDGISLVTEFRKSVPTMPEVPDSFRGPIRAVFHMVLHTICESHGSNQAREERAWKMLMLLPRLLLRPTSSSPTSSHRDELRDRVAKFWAGEWNELLQRCEPLNHTSHKSWDEGEVASKLVKKGQLSKAASVLTSHGLAPMNDETKAALTDPEKRPRDAYEPLPQYPATAPVVLDPERIKENIRSVKKSSSPGRAGLRGEHLRLLLDTDSGTFELLCQILNYIANADVPDHVKMALRLGSLTPLRKVDYDGTARGVRGICTGHLLRRIVARTLAQKHRQEIEEATSPEQLAMGSRSGMDLATLTARSALELDPDLVLISIDGVGAYDHISRKAMFDALNELPAAREMLPFLRIFYGQQSTFYVSGLGGDDAFDVTQGEGGEQGDALMPALFSLGLNLALRDARASLQEGETAFAFLDDVYLLVKRANARARFDRYSQAIFDFTRVRTNLGKIRCWGCGSATPPPGIAELGAEVWRGNLAVDKQGLIMLGSPIGSVDFAASWCASIAKRQSRLLNQLSKVSDAQCRWLLLKYCAEPTCSHIYHGMSLSTCVNTSRNGMTTQSGKVSSRFSSLMPRL